MNATATGMLQGVAWTLYQARPEAKLLVCTDDYGNEHRQFVTNNITLEDTLTVVQGVKETVFDGWEGNPLCWVEVAA
jgi:hypothetical protein